MVKNADHKFILQTDSLMWWEVKQIVPVKMRDHNLPFNLQESKHSAANSASSQWHRMEKKDCWNAIKEIASPTIILTYIVWKMSFHRTSKFVQSLNKCIIVPIHFGGNKWLLPSYNNNLPLPLVFSLTTSTVQVHMETTLLQLVGCTETLKVKFHWKREDDKTFRDWDTKCKHSASIELSLPHFTTDFGSTWRKRWVWFYWRGRIA